jgi:hypothetical protein
MLFASDFDRAGKIPPKSSPGENASITVLKARILDKTKEFPSASRTCEVNVDLLVGVF